jgi:lambda family phage portal protein
MKRGRATILDQHGKPVSLGRAKRRAGGQARALFSGFKGANDENLQDWAFLPIEINTILRNDLQKLRARSRDLARNDDTTRRFLALLKQNVLGHAGIKLQGKNKLRSRKPDVRWNEEIEREWGLFGRKRRSAGMSASPSVCGQMTLREFAWLALWTRAIDGECFIQILRGYPHNRHRFAMRLLNPDLLDSSYCVEPDDANRIEMGIEFDEYDRPVAYHFSKQHPTRKYRATNGNAKRERIPASQILHLFRHEYVGQIRGVPDFAAIMHKTKMLNGVHEAIVVGWRVAAAKMGFFVPTEPEDAFDTGEEDELGDSVYDATPGSFEVLQNNYDLKLFDPDYPTSTYESGHRVFMQQLANGLNVSSPTLSNDYSKVNYSSLRQALLEDREAWRCIQAEMIDGFYQPLFDEWYDWALHVTERIKLSRSKRHRDPVVAWQPRGWPWVDPLKEVKAQIASVGANLRTRQSIIAETSGADFMETADALQEEKQVLEERDLPVAVASSGDVTEKTEGEEESDG